MVHSTPAPPSIPRPAFARDWWAAVGVLGATAVAYLPSLAGGMIWNDQDYLTAPGLCSLGGLGRIWFKLGATQQYYPALHSAFWVQHQLWGYHPLGYHLVTLALHLMSVLLFAVVLRRLAVPGAWLAAMLFALHPVHVESVAWISEQKNTLSLVFYLLAALEYLRFDETRRPRDYAGALALFTVSLLCKTVTATLPAALLVIFWWKRGNLTWRREVRPLLPWLVLGGGWGLFSSWVEQRFLGAQGEGFVLPMVERGLVAGRAVWFYLGNLVWPFNLNFIYERWTPDRAVWWQWLFVAGVAGLVVSLWAIRENTRAPLAALLFFIGSLFPVLGFVNLYGALYSFVWDHWQYLPDLGFFALAGAGLAWVGDRPAVRVGWVRPASVVLLAGLMGALTWRHGGDFHDDETLYRTTLARNPGCWMAHNNLGQLLENLPGRGDEAIAEFDAALRIKPDHWGAHNNRGLALLAIRGRVPDAIAEFQTVLRAKPDYTFAHLNLGIAWASTPGRLPDAISEYREALRLSPDYPEAHNNLGNALASLPGRLPEAMAEFQAALRVRPDYVAAHLNLGNALADTPGRLEDAIAEYRAAVRIAPDHAEVHNNLGLALAGVPGRLPDALAEYHTALRIRPDYAKAHINLGNALALSADGLAEAVSEYEAALRSEPHSVEAQYNLGLVLLRMPGRIQEARAHFEAVLRSRPDFEPARQMVARLNAASR